MILIKWKNFTQLEKLIFLDLWADMFNITCFAIILIQICYAIDLLKKYLENRS